MNAKVPPEFTFAFFAERAAAIAEGKDNPAIDAQGRIVSHSRNLAGIRRLVGQRLVEYVQISRADDGRGALYVYFADGTRYYTPFASFDVLREFVRRWRNIDGAPLYIDGERAN